MIQDTIFAAIERGHAAAKLAADHAGDEWQEQAFSHLKRYAYEHDEMQALHIRLYAENCGLAKAPDSRAWGHILRRAAKLKILKATDRYVATDHMGSHGRPQRVWKSLVRI